MRKAYLRRCFILCFILSLVSMFILVFSAMFSYTQGSVISLIYTTSSDCSLKNNKSLLLDVKQLSSVPPHYLVVPYREFVLRTTISCRTFKLVNKPKNLSKFYPNYSTYLRGRFPYVVPNENITYDDVDKFYLDLAKPRKQNTTEIKQTSFAENITFEHIPYKYHNGMWEPIGVISAQRTAILVPLQNRDYNAKVFLFNIHAFARRQQLTYTVILVEQIRPLGNRFNKGRLYNTAVRYIEEQQGKLNISCIVLHDVDLLPENDGNFYSCEPAYPKHTTSRVRQFGSNEGYTRYYEFLIGGVLILTFDMYKSLNGFSNKYWGWGGEDDDLALRFIQQKMCVIRPSYELAVYMALPHRRGQRNNARFGLLTWATLRMESDGYLQIESFTRITHVRQTSTVTHLKVNVDANRNLYKLSLTSNILRSTNIKPNSVTTSFRTIPTSLRPRKPS